jgi:hypothetical protein
VVLSRQDHFPMQNWLKMESSKSSVAVLPQNPIFIHTRLQPGDIHARKQKPF